MANAPITKPFLHQAPGQPFPGLLRAPITDNDNTFTAQEFVVTAVDTGVTELVALATDGTAVFGLVTDASHAATDEPYNALYGQLHNVIDPRGALFVMNLTDGSGTVGSGTTTQATAVIGTRYAGRLLASPYTTTMGVDLSDSGTATKNIFQVQALYPSDAAGDYNGRVIVKIIDSAIQ